MTIKSRIRFAWDYLTESRSVRVTDKLSDHSAEFAYDDLPTEIQAQVELYGLGKLLQDRNSQVAADAKMDGFNKVFAQVLEGEWKSARTGGGLGIVPAHIEVIALKRGWTGPSGIAKAQKAWKATSEDTRAELLLIWAEDIDAIKEARSTAEEVESLDDMLS